MELHQFRYFAAVARTGNFTRAAAACHVSQPSLSQQILKLEDEVGSPLFERRRSRVTLTLAGELLLPHAQRVLGEVSDAGIRLRAVSRLTRGRLRLGVIPTIAPYLLPRPLARFRREHPGVSVSLREGVTGELIAALEADEMDLIIASTLPAATSGVKPTRLFREPLLLALPLDHPLVGVRRIEIDALRTERFIALRDEHCLSVTMNGFCKQNHLSPNIACQGSQVQTILALVASGFGISLVPAMACRDHPPPGVLLRPLGKNAPFREVVAYQRQGTRPMPAVLPLLALLRGEADPRV